MKKIVLIVLFAMIVSECFSKEQVIVVGENNAAPRTALQITLVVRKDVVKVGPYARYAQQYLGVVAPLSDRTSYSVETGAIDILNNNITDMGNISSDVELGFPDMCSMPVIFSSGELAVNRVGSKVKSLKEMALDAANTIYTIRKRRLDLITGDSQDMFGEGLRSAIEEMSRLEKEYIELFVGKKSISYSTHVFGVVPKDDIFNYVLCRFSGGSGVLDILSSKGKPVSLILAPENGIDIVTVPVKDKKKEIETIIVVSDWVNCSIIYNKKVVMNSMLKMYRKLVLPTENK